MMIPLLLVASTLAASGAPVPREALPPAPHASDAPRVQPLRFDWARDLGLTGGAAALLLTSEFFKDELAPEPCRWCDRNAAGEDTLNALDRWGRGIAGSAQAQKNARTWSNVVTLGVLPAGTFGTGLYAARGSGASGTELAQDATMVAQAVLFSALTNQAVKFIAGRERPFVHELPASERPLTDKPEDNNLSFYSGHSSFAFALVTSVGTVAELRGYEHAGYIWAVGLPIAATVPLLRMAASKHYLTDVATGAVVGAAFGVGIPLLLHPRLSQAPGAAAQGAQLNLSAGPGSLALSGRF
ncbi:phosphatase PAP2 family protein [Aggregicoccus sp. 17bor-14]|uniref:phosphatase PAP2 family protein n=1 Tax=Myxococcaceae TaxID=31 RepID=UPI00129CC841|nr:MULTISPECIES: phosphatase PAP2 family protein [Myxococcaceae]MBF5041474.1 phosphatase PAP2 family protein [Simulacricoccus sp. 17bor-14]MRI87258.1 phosphatase PAP2 family protein [Aggregicoccus sp. 17bor-14]